MAPKLKKPQKFVQPEMLHTSTDEAIHDAIHAAKSDDKPTKEDIKNLRNAVVMLMLNQRDMREWLKQLTDFVSASYPSEMPEPKFGQHVLTIDDCYEVATNSEGIAKALQKSFTMLEEKLNTVAKTLEEALQEE